MINNYKWFIKSIITTIFIYSIAYFFSSREVLIDIKNISIIFILNILYYKLKEVYNHRLCDIFFAIFVGMALFIPLIGYLTDPAMLKRLMKDILFFINYFIVILLLPFIVNRKKVNLVLIPYVILLNIMILGMFLIFIYYVIFDVKLSTDSLIAIFQTNYFEGLEFIKTYIGIYYAILFFGTYCSISICLYVGFKYLFNRFYENKNDVVVYNKYIFLIFLVLNISCIMFVSKSYIIRTIDGAVKLNQSINEFNKNHDLRMLSLKECNVKKSEKSQNIALVIGETNNRSHMSLYGYERDTTPWLNLMVKENKVIDFEHSYACAAQTQSALEMALTEKSQYNNIVIDDAMTIVEMAKHAGYYVIWITNQTNDSIAGLIASQADQTIWLNDSSNDTYQYQKNGLFDINVVTYLKNLKENDKKVFYIIHLLGSHASYDCRYPEDFNKWNDVNNKVNSYDNSILYNDYIMSNITNILMKELNVDGIVYFSDHGEEVSQYFCHGTDFFKNNYNKNDNIKDIVRIPMYMIFSQKFIYDNQNIIDNLKQNKEKYFTNDMIYDTVLGLMGINCCHYNINQDISSENYNFDENTLLTGKGEIRLKDCL